MSLFYFIIFHSGYNIIGERVLLGGIFSPSSFEDLGILLKLRFFYIHVFPFNFYVLEKINFGIPEFGGREIDHSRYCTDV